jgi:uncharacterized protein YqgC (DUF456 family)
MSALGAKKTGASGWATLASMVGGFIGLLVFSLLFIHRFYRRHRLVEYSRHKDWNKVCTPARAISPVICSRSWCRFSPAC